MLAWEEVLLLCFSLFPAGIAVTTGANLLTEVRGENSADFIGQCDEGTNYSEYYQELVKSLMSKDKNLFNLS